MNESDVRTILDNVTDEIVEVVVKAGIDGDLVLKQIDLLQVGFCSFVILLIEKGVVTLDEVEQSRIKFTAGWDQLSAGVRDAVDSKLRS